MFYLPRRSLASLCLLVLVGCGAISALPPSGAEEGGSPVYDLVLRGGRVLDPETGLDAVRDVGIVGGRIEAVSRQRLSGARVLDVSGRVVAPGFIDLHTHSPTPLGDAYQVRDGVTTALDLEAGAYPVSSYGRALAGRARMNYGASVGWATVRGLVVGQAPEAALTALPPAAFLQPADAGERARMRVFLERGLAAGGLGIGLPLDYFSAAVEAAELDLVFGVAARAGVPVFVHIRRGINGDPAGLIEVLELAREHGAALHVAHLSHSAMRATSGFLARIREARAQGVDVTTEVLPYNAGSAPIGSAVFGRDWRTIFGIDYADVEWAATGERFDEARWRAARRDDPGGQVIHHYLKDDWTRAALAEPGVVVVSDLLPMVSEDRFVAPHNGAFTRVLGRYAREAGVLSIPDAVARMTWLPARRLEAFAPAFARKGRVQVGADADLTVFDAARVRDRATYRDPYQPPVGVETVIVGGEVVVDEGRLVPGVFPGRRVLASP